MSAVSRRAFLAAAAALPSSLSASGAAPSVPEVRRGGMVYRRLGQTELYPSLLSFGSHTDPAYKRKVKYGTVLTDEGQALRDNLLSRALDQGVNMVDVYETEGQWEHVARVVRPHRARTLVSVCRQVPMFVGDNIDLAARLYGHVDMYRIYLNDTAALNASGIADWDVLRKAKQAGKVRAIGISTHDEQLMVNALRELEGLDYIMFPYNFIHARADYSEFLPAATAKGVGLIAIKPLAAGSIVKLDPRGKPGSRPEQTLVQLYQTRYRPLHPAVVAELTKSLQQMPDETLCQAALRFVYSRPFITCAMPGMFEDYTLDENIAGLRRHLELSRAERAALTAAGRVARASGGRWLRPDYQWLDNGWSGKCG
jgi:aryl-alcohol dehydrogenase-like predicted oxidoreductase